MRYLLIIFLLCGCASFNTPFNCEVESLKLSRKLQYKKVSHIIVYGLYKGKGHCWIEQKGKIVDVMQWDIKPSNYTERRKVILYNY